MLIVGRIGLVAFAKLTRVPATVIIPIVVMLCIVGSYLETRSVFAVVLMLAFAALGYLMHRFDYSRVTFLIGFVIGPQFELSLRQSLIITDRDPAALLGHPFAIAILVLAVVVSVLVMRARAFPRSSGDNA
jgi:putative tricarboxylic transport membrane protein